MYGAGPYAALFLTAEEAVAAQEHGFKFLDGWQHLAWRAFSQNVCAFRLRPKLHYSYHMLERLTDTYENSSKADQKRYREREREGEGRGRGRERETGRGRHRECNMYTP
jgi:hypothetical protein